MPDEFWIYSALIFLAGFIDSVVGGGGLMTVPALTLLLGPGALAIGTNKILGTAAALTALIIYTRKGHLQIKPAIPFLLGIAGGTVSGASVASVLPVEVFKWLILLICPLLLVLILKKDFFIREIQPSKSPRILLFLGLACGFYDGVFGPGGGTFMFLSLYMFGGMSLLVAMTTSKLANTISASFSLATFHFQGNVSWSTGLPLMLFIVGGAFVGSQLAAKNAPRIVRPALIVVVTLLVLRVSLSG